MSAEFALPPDLEERLAQLSPAKRAFVEQQLRAARERAPDESVPRRRSERPAPLSFAQELVWRIEQTSHDPTGYSVPCSLRLQGTLDADALQQALDEIVVRHEILRTTVEEREGEPVQRIHPPAHVPLASIDLRSLGESERNDGVETVFLEAIDAPFDLSHGPLVRAVLVRTALAEHALLIVVHHLAWDLASREILLRELALAYNAARRGERAVLAPLPLQFSDVALWQREWLNDARLERELAFWREQFPAPPARLEMPLDFAKPPAPGWEAAREPIELARSLADDLLRLGATHGATAFVVLLAAFQTLLYRYTGNDEIVVGSVFTGRSRPEFERLIGYFANTLPLRARFTAETTFEDLLASVRDTLLAATDHADVPYERLALEVHRGATRPAPLFTTMFTLLEGGARMPAFDGLTVAPLSIRRSIAKVDLSLTAILDADRFALELKYRTDLFVPQTIRRMLGHLCALIAGIVAEPRRPLAQLPLLTMDEERELLRERNATAVAYPSDRTIYALIREQMQRTPDAVALEWEDGAGALQSMRYGELAQRTEHLAAYLRTLGVGPNVGVGIGAPRSPELITALLAILAAGGYYVPFDPDYPAGRLRFMLEQTGVPVVVTLERHRAVLTQAAGAQSPHIIALDAPAPAVAPAHDCARDATPDDLAYVMYTSGSTGRPKGVMIEQRSVVNYLTWLAREYHVDVHDAILQRTAITFDVSVPELYLPLICGARIVLAPAGPQEPARLLEAIERSGVTLLQLVPSQLRVLLEAAPAQAARVLGGVRRLYLGGEATTPELLRRLFEACPGLAVTNLYGPTETTVFSSHWRVDRSTWDGKTISLGIPVANTSIYVLDANRQPVPLGVTGEIAIGGAGLARGYLQAPELTSERFIDDPFDSRPGMRLYRTGDLARYRPGGVLEYLGRNDGQVKLRGHRIEFGEIERALVADAEIADAVVLLREDTPGDQRLVAYCLPSGATGGGGERRESAELRERLRGMLPEIMVPSTVVWLDAWPLSDNGKLDRKALPAPQSSGNAAHDTFVAPRTPTEATVAQVWSEVLGSPRIGVRENFFALGGHSLLAMRILVRLSAACSVELSLRAFVEAPTVEELSALIDERRRHAPRTNVAAPIPRAARTAYRAPG